jgi:hypothetical protein
MFLMRCMAVALGLACCWFAGGCEESRNSVPVAAPQNSSPVTDSKDVESSRREVGERESSGIHRVIGSPVTATLSVEPIKAKPGDVVALKVKLEIEPLWEVGALGDGEAAATELQLEVPPGIVVESDWQAPKAIRSMRLDGHSVYVGEAVFFRKLRVSSDAPVGELPVKCRLSCQTCNDQQCLATEVDLAVVVRVQ